MTDTPYEHICLSCGQVDEGPNAVCECMELGPPCGICGEAEWEPLTPWKSNAHWAEDHKFVPMGDLAKEPMELVCPVCGESFEWTVKQQYMRRINSGYANRYLRSPIRQRPTCHPTHANTLRARLAAERAAWSNTDD